MLALLTRSGVSDAEVALPLPGDDLVPDATDVIDRAVTLPAPPAAVWPWLVQLGKGRAGWYFPRRLERVLPKRGLRRIEPSLQQVAVGDDIPDWGPGEPVFRAVRRRRAERARLALVARSRQPPSLAGRSVARRACSR